MTENLVYQAISQNLNNLQLQQVMMQFQYCA